MNQLTDFNFMMGCCCKAGACPWGSLNAAAC